MSRQMKNSVISWIGDIPKTWCECRLKNVGTLYGGLTRKSGDDFNVNEDDTSFMLYIPFTNIFNNSSINPTQLAKVKIEVGEEQHLVRKGDLLFLMSSEDLDGVGKPAILEEQINNLGLNSFCKGLNIYNPNTHNKFLFYLMSSHLCRELIRQEAKGFIRVNLRQDKLSCCPILLPPLSEQKAIADFLDTKCAEIDQIIVLQEKMIDKLRAYRQSLISDTVFRGIGKNVNLMNSGQEWLGKIPAHWELRPLKYVFTQRREKNDPIKSTERLSLSIGAGVTPYAEKTTNLDRFKDDFTQYQLAYPNDIVLNCMNMIVGAVGRSDYLGCVSPVYYVIYPTHEDNPYYYGYLLNTPAIRSVYHALGQGIYAIERGDGRVNTCRLKVPYEDFGRITIPVPPIDEQQAIADFLDTKTKDIDQLITIKQKKIEELKEYKKSLIYEYVTGKKEVDG